MAKKQTKPTPASKCAAQHFGLWMVHGPWFSQAVAAVKDGTFVPVAEQAPTVAQEGGVYDSGNGDLLYWMQDGIAVIPFSGQVVKGRSSFGGASTVVMRQALRQARVDDRVHSILLQIDSPGGTVAGTADLADDVRATDREFKPVYAWVEDLCCSAAFWIASQCRQIFANATAQVGSIGVMTYVEDTSGMYEKAGIKVVLIATGKLKGQWVEGNPVSEDYIAAVRTQVADIHEHFLAAVMDGRHMTHEQAVNVADGNVWIASKAKALGLIDAVSTLDAVFEAITQEAHMAITREQFEAFAAENPGATAKYIEQGKTQAREDLKAMTAAFPGHEAWAAKQFAAGRTVDQAKDLRAEIDAATAGEKARADAAVKEADKAKADAGSQGAIPTSPASENKPIPKGDHKAQAAAEWDADASLHTKFSSKERFLIVREQELKGNFRMQAK